MSLSERHAQAVARLKGIREICIDCGGKPAPDLPAKLRRKATIVIRTAPGGVSQRLASYLQDGADEVIAVSADSVVDSRLFELAVERGGGFVARDRGMAAILLPATVTLPPAESLPALGDALIAANTTGELKQSDFPGFIRGLRRVLPFWLLPVRDPAERHAAERFMFKANYKGSTDFLTKYVYPLPVRLLLQPLARWRVHPNWVTALNVVLGIAAVPAFALGSYWVAFICAYVMSLLDSVDGKLARLTYADSKLGTLMDHGLDLIHPPFWYLAWAWAVAGGNLHNPVIGAGGMLVMVYILDRLVLKIYSVNFRRGLHAHAPIDGRVRTWIARRNINLPIFTLGVIFELAAESFYLILAWQLATLLWHACRVGWILLLETAHPARA